MTPIPGSDEASGIRRYRAAVPAVRPATDYTVRIVPHNADAAVPLEAPHIHWQR